MNRFALGAAAVAAVLGTSGGVALAAVHEPASSGRPAGHVTEAPSAVPTAPAHRSSTTPRPTHSSEPTGAALEGDPGGPVYASGNVIHDGTARIRLREKEKIDAFTEAAGGYLVSTTAASSAAPLHDLWFVQTDRHQKKVATVAGDWDLSADGRSVVASDPKTHSITVWDVSSGTVVGQWGRAANAGDRAVFVGNAVYITDPEPGDRYALSAWDYESDTTRPVSTDGLADMTSSPFGDYLAGTVGQDGHADPQQENTCAAVRSTPSATRKSRWHSCQWSRAVVNANGEDDKALLVSRIADREASYAVTGAATGPDHGVTSLHPSATVLGASWATSTSVMLSEHVRGAGGSRAYRLESCGLDGHCHVVATADQKLIAPLES